MSMEVKNPKKDYVFQVLLYDEKSDEGYRRVTALIRNGCFFIMQRTNADPDFVRCDLDRETTIAFLNSLPCMEEAFPAGEPADLAEQNRLLHTWTEDLLHTIHETFAGSDALERWERYCEARGFGWSTKY